MSRTPELSEVIKRAIEAALGRACVGQPGRVQSYNAATQTADVQPLIKSRFDGEDGVAIVSSMPVIPKVPIMFPGGGGLRVTFPLIAGDEVWLLFADRSIDKWKAAGGEQDPGDVRQHHLADAVAIPGLHANNHPWSGAETGVITIGLDSGAAAWVARADAVDARLAHLEAGLNGHAHASFGAPATPIPDVLPVENVAGSGVVGTTASTSVKVKG